MLENKVSLMLEKIKKEDRKINSFLYINPNALEEAREIDAKKKKGKLYGKVIGVKSNINVFGMPASCASKTLENYTATYDATVIEKIKAEDGLIIGMLNMDEFAAGSSGESSAFGVTENPVALGKIPGGSSSGSATSVVAGFCDIALGSDTGGSVRLPASFCGVVGVKPSYGSVSRYGLIDLAMSLDQVGACAKNVEDATLIMGVISGKDERDSVTFDFEKGKNEMKKKLRFGFVRLLGVDKKIQKLIDEKIKALEKNGWVSEEIEIKNIELAVQTYYPLVYSEFFSATRGFDGRRYGGMIEDRAGAEVLRRIFGGGEITKAEFEHAYYEKALEVKEMIKREFETAFSKVDFIVMPISPIQPWKIGEGNKMKIEEVYAADALTSPINLAEACAVSIPVGKIDGMPVGMQIVCARGEDVKMFEIARRVENN